MSKSITIEEKTHKFWKLGTCLAAILSILLFILYWNSTNPLPANSYRLGAFIFFILTVFGGLELKNSSLTITLTSNESQQLIVTYKNKSKTVRKEEFDYSSIKEIKKIKEGKHILNSYLEPNTKTLKISFNDSKNELHLFEFSGRPLFFNERSIQKVISFLKN